MTAPVQRQSPASRLTVAGAYAGATAAWVGVYALVGFIGGMPL